MGGPVVMQSSVDRFVSDLSTSNTKTVWLVSYETYYYDPHNALLARLGQSGQTTEVALPADPDDSISSQQDSHLRLIRLSVLPRSRSNQPLPFVQQITTNGKQGFSSLSQQKGSSQSSHPTKKLVSPKTT
jgi:hypothetical protein